MNAPFHFQAFTAKVIGTADRIITDITVLPAFDPASPPNPRPTGVTAKALWDTGATRSVIGQDLVQTVGLAAVGSTQVNHGGGISVSPTYLVNFELPNKVVATGVLVTEFPAPPGFNVIVGMDVICCGDFSITNLGGNTWLSFRTPSCATIDYVDEAHRVAFSGVGRNARCPCGSGKKYKKCHGSL